MSKLLRKWTEETREGNRQWLDTKIMGTRMTIHKYIGCGDSLFVSWGYLFNKHDLGTTDWEEAKTLAIEKARDLLEKGLSDIAEIEALSA